MRRELMNGFRDTWAEQRPEIGIIFEPVADFDRRMPILVAAGEWGDQDVVLRSAVERVP